MRTERDRQVVAPGELAAKRARWSPALIASFSVLLIGALTAAPACRAGSSCGPPVPRLVSEAADGSSEERLGEAEPPKQTVSAPSSPKEDVVRASARASSGETGEGTSRSIEEDDYDSQPRGHGRADQAPGFRWHVQPLSVEVRKHMMGRSWHEGCPTSLDELVLVTTVHWDMDARETSGELVVAADVADDLEPAFRRLYDAGFPIHRMRRIDHYDGDDDASMSDNNSSAFNCRRIAGSSRWSEHSFGTALDLNPVQNPYVRGSYVAPPEGRAYLERDDARPGMVVPGPAVDAFLEIGWRWGGAWRSAKDYQHFSRSGR